MQLESGSNYLRVGVWKGKECIEKHYENRLRTYDVNWPVSRARVESGVMKLLGEFSSRSECRRVYLPEVYAFDPPDLLRMEFCEGVRLHDLTDDPSALPDASGNMLSHRQTWQNLFSFLQQVNGISYDAVFAATDGAIAHQQPITACMYHWKMSDRIDPPDRGRRCLCLGDLSINNILWDDVRKRFILLDLECAHWGFEGYDAGQLLGMLASYDQKGDLYQAAREGFLEAVPEEAQRACCRYWEQRFYTYYSTVLRLVKIWEV